ncbi:conditioned medium-induced protein 4 [Halobacteriales archaeon Cl-PHB]
MDEKTEELRDIFLDVADDETVTESQAEGPGTLAGGDEGVDERLVAVVDRMRDREGFRTDLDDAAYPRIVRGFYDGQDDGAIADALDRDPATVFAARADLHLIDADDTAVDLDALRDALDADPEDADGAAIEAAAATLDADAAAVRRATTVLAARQASRGVSHRFRSEFEDAIPAADLSVRLTAEANEDGLREATEDAEVDTDF